MVLLRHGRIACLRKHRRKLYPVKPLKVHSEEGAHHRWHVAQHRRGNAEGKLKHHKEEKEDDVEGQPQWAQFGGGIAAHYGSGHGQESDGYQACSWGGKEVRGDEGLAMLLVDVDAAKGNETEVNDSDR